MVALQIRVLGPLEIVAGGMPVAVRAGKLRIVLACLALRPNTLVSTDFLADAVWGERPPSQPGPQLQVYLANLRSMLEPGRVRGVPSRYLPSRPGGYSLVVGDEELDLLQFRRHVDTGRQAVQAGELADGARHLRNAIQLFRGPAFPDLADLEMLRPEVDALEESRLNAYQDLLDAEILLGREPDVVDELKLLTSQHPYRERLWALLVLALYRCSRQAEALAACRSARNLFVRDLGIELSGHLRTLESMVLRQDASLDPAAADLRRRARERLNNLPASVTPLIGRETELGEVCSLYRSDGCRLVTVTGPGGTGKTRLALAAASKLGQNMADGVGWVSLATLTHPAQVPSAVALSLGLGDLAGEDPLKTASRFLRSRRMLLVLDNFEHLEGAWPVVMDMLTAAPDLRILATSRRRLGLRPEYEYELAPLPLPPLDPVLPPNLLREIPSVKLLLARGRAVRYRFDVGAGNAAVLTRLCHQLDGLPLAIELAAAQLGRRSEDALLKDLEISRAALPGAFRDVPERQRTLTATIDWSYRLLAEDQRQLFDQMGVFAANPSVPAIVSISGTGTPGTADVTDRLAGLVQHSLLRRYSDPGGQERVAMLHSIREFARRRLDRDPNAAALRARHADYYLGVAKEHAPVLWGSAQLQALHHMQADAADFRAALLWAAGPDGSSDVALGLVGHLWHFWELTGDVAEQHEVSVDLVNSAPDAAPGLLAPALSGAATLSWTLGKNRLAAEFHGRARDMFRRAGNRQGAAWSAMCLAVQAAQSNEAEKAEHLAWEAFTAPDATDRTKVGALVILSRLAFYRGDYARSLELCRRGAVLARPIGDGALQCVVLTNLAESLEHDGDFDSAERLLTEAVAAALKLGAMGVLAGILESLAGVYLSKSRAASAIRLLAVADAHRADRGVTLDEPERRRVDELIGKAYANTGQVRFSSEWAAGQADTLAHVATEVLQQGHAHLPQPDGATVSEGSSGVPRANAAPWE
ncbi:BTAD domain-containing putative transcriptional regulator [Pseudarthrobacter sp. alpha12b]